jgi:ech hydrogenase subunit D
MIEPQPITTIDRNELVAKAYNLASQGCRLVQICCTTGETTLELTYSFDKDYAFSNLRVIVPRNDAVVPSITDSYLAAFTYENELQDLFGFTVTGLAINYNGKFYITAVKHPFLQKKNTSPA